MTQPVWLPGLPFDVATLDEVRARIFAATQAREQLVFATPNVSFLAQASRDARFRDDILRTGLSLPDGMPLVWLGRLLGIPFPERVAGSDLLESLITDPGPRPLRTYFFGGERDAATAAMQAVNQRGGGLVAVGAHYPGFVSIEQMSSDSVIQEINRSNADLLVVALGAAKGHRWIEANRHRLDVPVISHLGAAINFVAGRLQRAPRMMQRAGIEWLWRIKEEPVLARRYLRDGVFLAALAMGFVVPELARRALRSGGVPAPDITTSGQGRAAVIRKRFGTREVASLPVEGLERLELAGVTQVDATSVGWLYARRHRQAPGTPRLTVACDATSLGTLRRWRAACLADG